LDRVNQGERINTLQAAQDLYNQLYEAAKNQWSKEATHCQESLPLLPLAQPLISSHLTAENGASLLIQLNELIQSLGMRQSTLLDQVASTQQTLNDNRSKVDLLANQKKDFTQKKKEEEQTMQTLLQSLKLESIEALLAKEIAAEELTELQSQELKLHNRQIEVNTKLDSKGQERIAHMEDLPNQLRNPDPSMSSSAQKDWLHQSREEIALVESKGKEQLVLHQDKRNILEPQLEELQDRLKRHKEQQIKDSLLQTQLKGLVAKATPWLTLSAMIGTKDFKIFAQSMNLQSLLDRANIHLYSFANRYQLHIIKNKGQPTLEFDVLDREQADERRAIDSLSGGETFLVSLALALGLSDFREMKMPIETLLLDEGFGTLDKHILSNAISALTQLQNQNRQVGIISHVDGLIDSIPAQVEVEKLGGGRSRIRIPN
jgi:exonuclease SbcC